MRKALGMDLISIHAPHEGERPSKDGVLSPTSIISIHAPHEGERPQQFYPIFKAIAISIHAPHEGERQNRMADPEQLSLFQSTLPTRGSDTRNVAQLHIYAHFNPRSPRGGATRIAFSCTSDSSISIHAPHEGERHGRWGYLCCHHRFQSTLPTRGSD